ncbi:MAG: GntR family transcriptional regulator [Saprospiraceae bacterium]|uniref:GntR family transcriptional regulator n=1 Tax=Candidatus Defluviibacterium haderslevense TaxID=2981993 RepID=A0A9D7XHM9_9BACT|nr:GntR family transcriptional regulator [Candidatus Defluviibacterium haderslevense]MCC7028137.1 GntR family transcriptional regulator [Saprospiraceae bacterium]
MDFRKHQPIYMQIAEVLLEDILKKRVVDGDRIPSVREMATTVQVNPNTVQRTYQWLQDEEIIFQKRGIGFFLCEQSFEKTLQIKKNEFVREVLPETIRQMKMLGITEAEWQALYSSISN